MNITSLPKVSRNVWEFHCPNFPRKLNRRNLKFIDKSLLRRECVDEFGDRESRQKNFTNENWAMTTILCVSLTQISYSGLTWGCNRWFRRVNFIGVKERHLGQKNFLSKMYLACYLHGRKKLQFISKGQGSMVELFIHTPIGDMRVNNAFQISRPKIQENKQAHGRGKIDWVGMDKLEKGIT